MLCYVMLCYVMYGNIYSTLIRKNMFIKLNPCFCRRYMYTNSYRKTSVTIEWLNSLSDLIRLADTKLILYCNGFKHLFC